VIRCDAIDAVLFDLDGTLVDTDDQAVERLATCLRVVRWLFPDQDPTPWARWAMMQAETPGNALLTLVDALGLDAPLAAAGDTLRAWGRLKHPSSFRPIARVPAMLEQLSGRYKLGLVTSRGRRHIAAFQSSHPEMAGHLQCFIGRQDTRRIKPHPAPLRLAATKLGVPIRRCLTIGDTPVDVRAARRAGAWSAAVLCGFGQRAELVRAGAHLVLHSTGDLAAILIRC
jgi:HAD superfamily hydrolase (TIGR01549 family)